MNVADIFKFSSYFLKKCAEFDENEKQDLLYRFNQSFIKNVEWLRRILQSLYHKFDRTKYSAVTFDTFGFILDELVDMKDKLYKI